MPWHVVKDDPSCPISKPWGVHKKGDDKVLGCHDNKHHADKQLAALYASENVVSKDEHKKTVFGWAKLASTADGKVLVDRQGDAISIEELEKGAYDYVLNSRDGGEMHINRNVGTVIESMVFTKEKLAKLGVSEGQVHEGWWIGFKIHDDKVWDQIVKGEYNAFSIHGTGRRVPISVPESNAEYEPSRFRRKPIHKSALLMNITKGMN